MPNRINGEKYRNAPARIVERVLATREVTPEGCWTGPNQVTHDGYAYATYRMAGKRPAVYLHRLVYLHLVGDPGDDAELDHRCHDPQTCMVPPDECPHRACFNPDHLEPVTSADNVRRSGARSGVNSRKTHCDRGHEFTAKNTRYYRGTRQCRECHRIGEAERRAAKRDQAPRQCKRCGTDISARHTAAIYCVVCNPPTWQGSAERTAAKRAAGRACACCGCDITWRHGRAVSCEDCGNARQRYGGHYPKGAHCPLHR